MGIPYLKRFPAVSLNVGGTVLVIVRAVDPVIIDQWVSGLCCVYSARYPGLSRPYDQFKDMYLRTGLFNIHDDGFVSCHDHIWKKMLLFIWNFKTNSHNKPWRTFPTVP